MKETEKEENGLIKKSSEFESKIDRSLLNSYKKIRSSVKNGLAVVPVERGASAGSFFSTSSSSIRYSFKKKAYN